MAKNKTPEFLFLDGLECVLCGQKDRPVAASLLEQEESKKKDELEKGVPKKGVCEVCAVRVYWNFKTELGDIPPGTNTSKSRKISRVKVLVPRLRSSEEGSAREPSFVDSYEFALVPSGKHWDLPTEDFDTDETVTALKALDKASLISWKWCIESLYRGYTPRGGLVSVVLATAYAKKTVDSKVEFRKWPVEDHVEPGLSGLYYAMNDVWALRLYKWAKLLKPAGGISVFMREAAKEYIRLKLAMRKSNGDVDTSMMEYYRKTMTPDEKYISELCLGGEKVDGEIEIQIPKTEPKTVMTVSPQQTEGDEGEDKPDLLEEFEQSDEDDDGEPPDGFVRQGNVLTTED